MTMPTPDRDLDAEHKDCGCSPTCLCRTEPPKICAWHAIGRRFTEMVDLYSAEQGWPRMTWPGRPATRPAAEPDASPPAEQK